MSEQEQPRWSASGREDGVAALVESAFHFRGDVTVRMTGGREATGYLFNRDSGRRRNGGHAPAFAQLFETATGREVALPYAEIEDILFTGRPGGRTPTGGSSLGG